MEYKVNESTKKRACQYGVLHITIILTIVRLVNVSSYIGSLAYITALVNYNSMFSLACLFWTDCIMMFD